MPIYSERFQARSISVAVRRRFEAAALYGAFLLIGAIVLGTFSIHPF